LLVNGAMSSCAAVSAPLWTTVPSATSAHRPVNSLTLVNRFSLVILTTPLVTSAPAETVIAW
jgi:hypothetical protein